ncbi:MAG: hypothetical protein GC191_19700 [Azospirillum sp.]|nr:hypothetical protein [Azospirillum sp.]
MSTFQIKNADDFFSEVVMPQYIDFLNTNSSSRHALLSILVVYHMYEWVFPSTVFSVEHFEKTFPVQAHLSEYFELARRISNGTKYFRTRKTVSTRTQPGFSSGLSFGFAKPLMVGLVNSSGEISADELLNTIIQFWKSQKVSGIF